ncbi:26383_t:CDS:2 [Dentiscutata erythropus]|uniref:Pyruvate dehydrogenase E1 component subunit alpha, mitochondrial n=1 Tax=Dentiscutata erythropus TaxID=1348616 RepID=A0A9N9HGB2_9GLOM|nr:26383_t:CDS:2 [Dentiscutata erythropus]
MLLPVSRVVTRVAACRGGSLFRSFASASSSDSVKHTLPNTSYKAYECDPPPLEIEVKKDDALQLYKDMVLMRRMETTADNLYKMKLIRGFCHLCTGQEAIPVGMEHAITRDDAIITAYRCHGYTLMRGATVHQILSELMGRSTGITYGKGGSMHMFAKGFYGGNVGTGIAFTQKYLGVKNATFIIYGDGAANQGQVFEAFNMAKLWDLPAIFVCENNLYGMGTSAARSSANSQYYTRGQYIPGLQVNGMDVLAVKQACAWAKDWTVNGKGPMVLEFVTYRYGGHSMSDPGTTYRTREEIQHMRSTNDPITGLRLKILEWEFADETYLKQYEKEARAIVDEAAEKAKNDPLPKDSELWTDVYVRGSEPDSIRGRECEEIGVMRS